MAARTIAGRILLTGNGEFEFVPVSTAVKYKCELVGTFPSIAILKKVAGSDIIIVPKWHWIESQVLVIDISSIETSESHSEEPDIGAGKSMAGKVESISAFLRIKDQKDPFNNSFCVHLSDGEVFVLRGPKQIWYRYLLRPGGYVEFSNFKRIKLKSLHDKIVYISMDDSSVVDFRNDTGGHSTVSGKVVSIENGLVWISTSQSKNVVLPIVLQEWKNCDRRKISPGSVITVSNFHMVGKMIVMCPASSSLVVDQCPPLTNPVCMYSINDLDTKMRCAYHRVNSEECCLKEPTKFGINSLIECFCYLQCEKLQTQFEESSATSLASLFAQAIRSAELCLVSEHIQDIMIQSAPPFFNTSLRQPVQLKLIGNPNAETTKFFKTLPSSLYLALFPSNKPLNSYNMVKVSEQENELVILMSRESKVDPTSWYKLDQLLILNTGKNSIVHGMLKDLASLTKMETYSSYKIPNNHISDFNNEKLRRRRLLHQKALDLNSY
jgi:hypothetical protein